MALALRASPSSTSSRAVLPGNRTLCFARGSHQTALCGRYKKPAFAGFLYLPQREFIEATAQAARHDEQQKQIEENARRKIIQEASADGCRFLTDNEKQLRLSYRKQEHKEECQKNPSLAYRLSCEVAYIKSFYEIEVLKELDGIMLCADGSELTVSL